MEICHIKDLKCGKENRLLKVRITRLWHVRKESLGISSINMILLDEKKDKIQGTIYNQDAITRHVNQFVEGRCYEISKFMIAENRGMYKTTKHQYRITLTYGTKVTPIDADIPLYAFDFVPIERILSETNTNEFLIDVIGLVSNHNTLQDYQHQGQTAQKLDFHLADLRNNIVRVTLFGEQAYEMSNFLMHTNQPKVVALQLARINVYKGEISLSTSWNITKVLMNPNIPEAATFSHISSSEVQTITQSTTQYSSASKNNFDKDFSNPDLRRSIFEIHDAKEAQRVTTLATIHEIIEDYNWFYLACNKCSKLVKTKDANSALWCNKCHTNPSLVIPKFKIHLRVMDQTGNACFVLFDREAFKLLHRTAVELKEDLIKSGNEYGFPDILYSLVGKQFLFMVEISKEFNIEKKKDNYTVIKISDNNDLIQQFVARNALEQEGDELDVSKILKENPLAHPILSDNETGSITGENETDFFTTPVISACKKKKSIINPDCDYAGITEIPTPQFSTSKSPIRKIPAHVKMEKLDP